MFGTQHLALFVVSGLLLNITPGQDTLYIVGRSLSQGRRAGVWSALGIASGSVVHTVAAALGLSAILATSATAFTAVKWAGALYLAYLGLGMLFGRAAIGATERTFVPASSWAIYRAGLLTNVLNPKVALFFMAFLPQFVAPDADSRLLAFLVLGSIFIVNGTAWCLVLVFAAAAVSQRLRSNQASGTRLKRLTGAIFVGLSARLAFSR